MIVTLLLLLLDVYRSEGVLTQRVAGRNCSKMPHSFMVAIFLHRNYKLQFLGGGTLLNKDWILTTGVHFYTDPRDIYYEAVAGADSLSEFYSNKPHLQISRFTEFHRTDEQIKLGLDIALLKLMKPMEETNRVSFVRWSTFEDISGKKLEDVCSDATIMGYGNSEIQEENAPKKYGDLHCGQIPVLPQSDCKQNVETFVPYQGGCIFGPNDACYGDAGGPVMCDGIQYGVLTYQYECGEGPPSLFIRVYTYDKFITKVIEHNNTSSVAPNITELKSSSNNNSYNWFLLLFVLVLCYILKPIID